MLEVSVKNFHDRRYPGVFKRKCDDLGKNGVKFEDGSVLHCKDWREFCYLCEELRNLDALGCFSKWKHADYCIDDEENAEGDYRVLLMIYEDI